ncbi:MAG: STAS domain-containing protein [Leptospiraceae bacterium]|nr:STAS domain-containing protein [Leptospiraceae bacterium]
MLDKSKSLTYRITDEGETAVVALTGDLNMFSAPDLRTNLVKKFDSGVGKFIFDLTDLAFVDSSGIGVLVSFVSLAKKRPGSKVVLCGLNPQIRSIFEVTRLLSVFTVVDDLDAARAALAA